MISTENLHCPHGVAPVGALLIAEYPGSAISVESWLPASLLDFMQTVADTRNDYGRIPHHVDLLAADGCRARAPRLVPTPAEALGQPEAFEVVDEAVIAVELDPEPSDDPEPTDTEDGPGDEPGPVGDAQGEDEAVPEEPGPEPDAEHAETEPSEAEPAEHA